MIFSPLNAALFGVFGLLGIGLYGLLVTRNLIKLVMVLQILTKASLLALLVAARATEQIGLGESMVLTVIIADTVVAVIGMGLAVQIQRHLKTLDINELSKLRG